MITVRIMRLSPRRHRTELLLPRSWPAARLTPYELASSAPESAMNIARFLQTLDNDANPGNGIHINDAVHVLAEDRTLGFSSAEWQDLWYSGLELVDGKWIATRPAIELLVYELTSATEAGARDLVSADGATNS